MTKNPRVSANIEQIFLLVIPVRGYSPTIKSRCCAHSSLLYVRVLDCWGDSGGNIVGKPGMLTKLSMFELTFRQEVQLGVEFGETKDRRESFLGSHS